MSNSAYPIRTRHQSLYMRKLRGAPTRLNQPERGGGDGQSEGNLVSRRLGDDDPFDRYRSREIVANHLSQRLPFAIRLFVATAVTVGGVLSWLAVPNPLVPAVEGLVLIGLLVWAQWEFES